jgi:hypothetical protein
LPAPGGVLGVGSVPGHIVGSLWTALSFCLLPKGGQIAVTRAEVDRRAGVHKSSLSFRLPLLTRLRFDGDCVRMVIFVNAYATWQLSSHYGQACACVHAVPIVVAISLTAVTVDGRNCHLKVAPREVADNGLGSQILTRPLDD